MGQGGKESGTKAGVKGRLISNHKTKDRQAHNKKM